MSASEVYSSEVKKTEVLMENFRRAIGLRIRETKEVYEGEVTALTPEEAEDPLGGYGKTISHVVIGLKTSKGSKQLRLDASLFDNIEKEKIQVGDVIYIEANSGVIKRVGRSDAYLLFSLVTTSYASEYDLEADEYVPIPKGEVFKKKEVIQDVTLHDLDVANAQPQGGHDLAGLMNQLVRQRKTEITEKLREEVNRMVNKYIEDGVAELVPGVLFIDEAHMLDMECFSFLNRALETAMAPILILATNRGITRVRGTKYTSPHGIPVDFLDRLLIIPTDPYDMKEMRQILKVRCEEEDVDMTEEAMELLTTIAFNTSLRYAMNMIITSSLAARKRKSNTVGEEDVKKVYSLFADVKRSTKVLNEDAEEYLYSETKWSVCYHRIRSCGKQPYE